MDVKNLCPRAMRARVAGRRPAADDRFVSGLLAAAVLGPVLGAVSGCGAEALVGRTRPARGRGRLALLVAAALLVVGATTWRVADAGAWWQAATLVLAVVAVPLSAVDLVEQRIPDLVLGPAFALALVLLGADAVTGHHRGTLLHSVLAAAVLYAGALLLLLVVRDSLGYGDVKALAYQGLYMGHLGWGRVLGALLLTFAAPAAVAAGLALLRRSERGSRLAFAPYVLGAALVVVLVG